ncbi:TrmH family RNA methyltransferase [Sediminihabitans luteus]|uniref:TrmH family RNA methyltransferase n=1 Tax=Sediminihabitans luteus TaxID=1138585 RepID=A0A2M9CCP5_9CELL|nr:RNA methyltransferase [Sediminihabitans luteus]PJJ69119.1 TrmH family RNA methyltransferase [Sediminihabitans luteus]GII99505.1 RNA methyltransferase [Sediminihabitans luteus]
MPTPQDHAAGPLTPTLENPRSDRVKAVRALSGRSARARRGRFLVEGPQSVRELVLHAPERALDVYVTPAAGERYQEIVVAARSRGTFVHVASDEVLRAMSDDAQGVLAVATTTSTSLADVLGPGAAPRLVAVLATVRDPGNAGTVVRASDAAGAGAVVLAGESVDLHNPKVVRSTAGSLFHVPVVTGEGLAETAAGLRAAGLVVLAADGKGTHDLDDLLDVAGTAADGVPDLSRPTAWVFGNEAWGLRDEDLALVDAVVRVPIRGLAESLNLATAATVCLYASARAQR